MSDSTLCHRAKAGDLQAASELLQHHYQKIFAFLRRLCGSDQEAEDLTQKTFTRVWTSLPSFLGKSSFSTWVHGIAHHVYLDWRRKAHRMEPQSDQWWFNCRADDPTPFESAADRDGAHHLYALVERLDPETRDAVHLHYYQGLTLNETAEVLNVSASTVKNRLRDAINFLRTKTNEFQVSAK